MRRGEAARRDRGPRDVTKGRRGVTGAGGRQALAADTNATAAAAGGGNLTLGVAGRRSGEDASATALGAATAHAPIKR